MDHSILTFSEIQNQIKLHSSMTTKETIASNLKALRKRDGYSMRKVASLVFVSTAAYQKYEEKRSEPGIGTLQRLAELYNVTVDEIIKESVKTSI